MAPPSGVKLGLAYIVGQANYGGSGVSIVWDIFPALQNPAMSRKLAVPTESGTSVRYDWVAAPSAGACSPDDAWNQRALRLGSGATGRSFEQSWFESECFIAS